MKEPFFINKKFFVNPSRNLIRDERTGIETHLEPRILDLLCIMSTTPGIMIERSYFIQKIWNDYAGGDDALTQAISFLRKAFDDKNRKLIETISKKGYVFNGVVSKTTTEKFVEQNHKMTLGKKYVFILVGIILLILTYLIMSNPKSTKEPTLKQKKSTMAKKIPTI
jgi:DNA-binding winged helix-turn-helix (wHTH) protein